VGRGILKLSDEYEVLVIKKGDLNDVTLEVELIPEQDSNVDTTKARLADQLMVKMCDS